MIRHGVKECQSLLFVLITNGGGKVIDLLFSWIRHLPIVLTNSYGWGVAVLCVYQQHLPPRLFFDKKLSFVCKKAHFTSSYFALQGKVLFYAFAKASSNARVNVCLCTLGICKAGANLTGWNVCGLVTWQCVTFTASLRHTHLKQTMIVIFLEEKACRTVVPFMHVRYFTMANSSWNCSCEDEKPCE